MRTGVERSCALAALLGKLMRNLAVNPGCSLFSASTWFYLGGALGLSARELQIAQGVFEDQKEEAIAAEMGISPHTVNTYFQRLYRKLNVCSRPQLIVRVVAVHLALADTDTINPTPAEQTDTRSDFPDLSAPAYRAA